MLPELLDGQDNSSEEDSDKVDVSPEDEQIALVSIVPHDSHGQRPTPASRSRPLNSEEMAKDRKSSSSPTRFTRLYKDDPSMIPPRNTLRSLRVRQGCFRTLSTTKKLRVR